MASSPRVTGKTHAAPRGARSAPPSRGGQLRSPAARRVPVLRGAFHSARRSRAPLPAPALRAPHAAAPQSSPGSPARTRPADRLPPPRSAPGLGSRHPLRAGDGCGRAGRGAAPPRPEPPGASGRGGPTGERRTRGSRPGARLGTPPGSCARWHQAQ